MTTNQVTKYANGYLIQAEYPECIPLVKSIQPHFDLILTDPPYSGIIKDKWDNEKGGQTAFANWLISVIKSFEELIDNGSSCYFWGAVGTTKNRPLFEVLSRLEHETGFSLKNLITWSKKRAIGTKYNYLFCREELTWLIKGNVNPSIFNIPYLDKLRECQSFNKKYECKSPYLRRTNVWTDITEILRKKLVMCQKPVKLYEIPIQVSSNEQGWIFDPFAGSGTCAEACINLNRNFVLIERNPETYQIAKQRIDSIYAGRK